MGANKRVIAILLDLLEATEHDAKVFKGKWDDAERKASDLFDQCVHLKQLTEVSERTKETLRKDAERKDQVIHTLKQENISLGNTVEAYRHEIDNKNAEIAKLRNGGLDPEPSRYGHHPAFAAVIQAVACDFCSSLRGHDCTTKEGNVVPPHAVRIKRAEAM